MGFTIHAAAEGGGAWAGAESGAASGAWLGGLFGGPLGAVIGGVIVGAFFGFLGSKAGELVADQAKPLVEEAGKPALDDVELVGS